MTSKTTPIRIKNAPIESYSKIPAPIKRTPYKQPFFPFEGLSINIPIIKILCFKISKNTLKLKILIQLDF